ncbi:hypothetical protein ENKOMM257B_06915 [Enterobacter kobei]
MKADGVLRARCMDLAATARTDAEPCGAPVWRRRFPRRLLRLDRPAVAWAFACEGWRTDDIEQVPFVIQLECLLQVAEEAKPGHNVNYLAGYVMAMVIHHARLPDRSTTPCH